MRPAVQGIRALGLTVVTSVALVLVLVLRSGSPYQAAAASAGTSIAPGEPASPTASLIPTTRPNPSVQPEPSRIVTSSEAPVGSISFTITVDAGKTIVIGAAGDCDQLGDAWLADWCANLVRVDPNLIPQTVAGIPRPLYGQAWVDFDRHMQTAYDAALLRGDSTICDSPVVDYYVSLGSHVTDGAATCRVDFSTTNAKGWFFVTSPDSGKNARIDLSSVKP